MQRPLFLEGEPGVGKTELAKAAAGLLGTSMLRLQCYEGLDTASALYEWDYPRQIMALRLAEASGEQPSNDSLYRSEFLLKRPLLQALMPDPLNPGARRVLLIDEIDRADEPFEAFLLELLSDFQVSIPEYGTVRAEQPPLVVMTSNRTREVHDALKRRCLYQWIGYPERDVELAIVAARAPEAGAELQTRAVAFVHRLRTLDLFKAPGVAETIDWCRALAALSVSELDPQSVQDTLGVLLKYQDDLARVDRAAAIAQCLAATGVRRGSDGASDTPTLARNVVHFVRLLARRGFADVAGASRRCARRAALDRPRPPRRRARRARRRCSCRAPDERDLFDAAFDLFWRDPDWEGKLRAMLLPKVTRRRCRRPNATTVSPMRSRRARRLAACATQPQDTEQHELHAHVTFSARRAPASSRLRHAHRRRMAHACAI